MATDNGEKFVKTRVAISSVIALLMMLLTFIAGKTYERFDRGMDQVQAIALAVAVHENRLNYLEKYSPHYEPGAR